MSIIKTQNCIDHIRRVKAQPESYLAHVEEYFCQLQAAVVDDEAEDWSELIAILESGDDLRTIGMNPFNGGLQDCFPEYIELYELSDGTAIYKIYVLHDNDCGTTFFTQKGVHDEEVEQWLKEQAER